MFKKIFNIINVVLGILFIFLIFRFGKDTFIAKNNTDVIPVPATNVMAPHKAPSIEPAIHDISSIKSKDQVAHPGAEPKNIDEIYSNFSKEDVGENFKAVWDTASPDDKKKVKDGIDEQIKKTAETIKAKPEDKKAKNFLFISESLKKMSSTDFNLGKMKDQR